MYIKVFLVLHLADRPDEFFKKGDVGRIPVDQVHTVSTQEEGAPILIFSINEITDGMGFGSGIKTE